MWRALRIWAVVLCPLAAMAAGEDGVAPLPQLPASLERSVQAHELLARRAKTSPEALCELVGESADLVHPLESNLIERTRELPSETEQRLWDELDRRVTGVYFLMSPEFSRSGVDYSRLAQLASREDAALLRGMAELDGVWRGIANVPAWQEAMTDYGGCHAPARATKTLAALARAWPSARPCMRDALISPLDRLLLQMTEDANFCEGDREQRVRNARFNAAQMRKLTGTRGRALAGALVESALRAGNRPPRAPG